MKNKSALTIKALQGDSKESEERIEELKRIKAPSEIKAPIFAEYFATIFKGKIAAFASAWPPHDLREHQIPLTEKEFHLLKKLWNWNPYKKDLQEAIEAIQGIQEKIDSYESLRKNK